MNKNLLSLIALMVLFGTAMQAQTVFTTRVATANDDLEEWLPGSTKVVGSVDIGSSDIELGSEAANNLDPQLVGLRFRNVTIPQGSVITRAYLRFTTDNTNKNFDPSNLIIKAQAADNADSFSITTPFPISTRATLADSVAWTIRAGSWTTVGESAADQTTPDLKTLVQALVNRAGWASGNAMVFTIRGTGTRESESADDEAQKATVLVIEYVPVTTLSKRVARPEDDQEEWLPGATKVVGTLDAGSSDLELGSEAANNVDPQLVGVRFSDLTIPKGAIIQEAYIQFTTDNTNKNFDPSNLIIKAQDADNPPSFNAAISFNITSRPTLADSVAWTIPAGSWATVGEAGVNQRTSNIARLVQALVNRNGWTPGNAMVFTIRGTGTKESESADDEAQKAPVLVVKYLNIVRLTNRVSAPEDDQEEWLPGGTKVAGTLDAGSSDLELGSESANNADPQVVGVRFRNLQLPQGAIVQNAYIQFTTDNTNKNFDPSNLIIKAQKNDNPTAFDANTPFNITLRPTFEDSIAWTIPAGSWATVGEAGVNQRTPNIARLVQTVINQGGWMAGNAMVFTIRGTGTKEAESADDEAQKAPVLVIEYLSVGGGDTTTTTAGGNATTMYPIKREDTWSYFDKGISLDSLAWKTLTFNDTTWAAAPGAFGYGLPDEIINTKVAFGANAQNKPITTYFRKRFRISNVDSLSNNLELNVLLDDGAVIYINGSPALTLNLPTSGVTSATLASSEVRGDASLAYFTYEIPKTLLRTGENIIAVEVHQNSASSPDLAFDLELRNRQGTSNASNLGCTGVNDTHIGCFTSLIPRPQNDTVAVPNGTHAFQYIAAFGDAYKGTAGTIPSNFDFTGYVPINGSSTRGYLSINHEKDGGTGGVSILEIQLNQRTGLWETLNSGPVDFKPVVGTTSNCSGTVTPWNNVITCEEAVSNTDTNNDGYHDYGWAVELEPSTRQVRDFGRGKQKLWRLGKMDHENVVVAKDQKTLYQGEDDPRGSLYKFIADQPARMDNGLLYALILDSAYVDGEPRGTTGRWVQIPNTTPTECNNVKMVATTLGATFFNGIEDVEISPIDSMIYFTVKGVGRVYRFRDNGTTISNFETFAGNRNYRLTVDSNKVVTEPWGGGNDNLTFDDRGNLWVLQDGGRNFTWVLRAGHTQANPKVEIFSHTPIVGEPTGMTFTPDFKYAFISMQEGRGQIPQKDVAGETRTFDRSIALVFARNQFLGRALTDTTAVAGDITPFQLVTSNGTVLVDNIRNNDTINVRNFSTSRFNIRAVVNNDSIRSIKFVLTGPTTVNRNENYAPFHVFGDLGRFLNFARRLPVGTYNLTATPYNQLNGRGTARAAQTLRFTVIDRQGLQNEPEVLFTQKGRKSSQQFNAQNLSLSIYPNPTQDWVTVRFDGMAQGLMRSRIVDQAGRVVREMRLMKDNLSVEYRLDLSNLAQGIYYIQTVLGNNVSSVRVVVTK